MKIRMAIHYSCLISLVLWWVVLRKPTFATPTCPLPLAASTSTDSFLEQTKRLSQTHYPQYGRMKRTRP